MGLLKVDVSLFSVVFVLLSHSRLQGIHALAGVAFGDLSSWRAAGVGREQSLLPVEVSVGVSSPISSCDLIVLLVASAIYWCDIFQSILFLKISI